MFNYTHASDVYFRNDIPKTTGAVYAPFIYLASIVLPFLWLADVFFAKAKPYNILFFKVFKTSRNPYADDVYQVSMYNAQDGARIVTSSKEQIALFLHNYLTTSNRPTYFVSYNAHHQSLTLMNVLKDHVQFADAKFIDLKAMFLNRYRDIEDVSYTDMIDMLGLRDTRSRTQMYQTIFEELISRYDDSKVDDIYKQLYPST
jgi:hypothetical protein